MDLTDQRESSSSNPREFSKLHWLQGIDYSFNYTDQSKTHESTIFRVAVVLICSKMSRKKATSKENAAFNAISLHFSKMLLARAMKAALHQNNCC